MHLLNFTLGTGTIEISLRANQHFLKPILPPNSNDFAIQVVQLQKRGEARDHREAVQLLQDCLGEQRSDKDVLYVVRMHARNQNGILRLYQDLEPVKNTFLNDYVF